MEYKMEEPETPQKLTKSRVIYSSPPAKKFHKIRNPFDAALTETLHLPSIGTIGSPSIFQRPMTPQLSSTQFEWNIDQASNLLPVNVEAHETQFHDSPDSEYEARAQSAISSYFKEHQVVPSPVDCPLHSQRILLSELNANTPISKSGQFIRDFACQTELSLPIDLPKEVEEALRPYFQPHLAGKSGYTPKSKSTTDFKDTSLRRQLFDLHSIIVLENDEKPILALKRELAEKHPNSSPLSASALEQRAIMGKLSDSLDKSSFGSLSPISGTESFSPQSCTKRKFQLDTILDQISPIPRPTRASMRRAKATHAAICQDSYRAKINDTSELIVSECTNFKPDRSSSPFDANDDTSARGSCTSESFNVRVSQLKLNSASGTSMTGSRISNLSAKSTAAEMTEVVESIQFNHTSETIDVADDVEDMQVSQLSTQSSNCSSFNSDTPRSKRRSASRKNLSQSFSNNWSEDEEEDIATNLNLAEINACIFNGNDADSANICKQNDEKHPTFYRTDSGFNEMTTNSSSSAFQQDENSRDIMCAGGGLDLERERFKTTRFEVDISMMSCSTPSKSIALDETL